MHDRIAELRGLLNELAICENGPRESRRSAAAEVRKEIDRLRAELAEHAKGLEKRIEELAKAGQDGAAAELKATAERIRTALEAVKPPKGRTSGAGKQTAAAAKPPEQA